MNRSLILLAALALACTVSKAQTEKGNENVGLTTALDVQQSSSLTLNPPELYSTTASSKQTTVTFGPHYSYFIANNLDIGLNLSYQSSVTTFNNTDPNVEEPGKLASKQYSSDIFIRKYFLHKNKIGIRAGAYVGYGHDSQATDYGAPYQSNSTGSKSNYGWAAVGADLVYYPSKRLGLAANLFNFQFEHYIENDTISGKGNGNIADVSFINDGLTLSIFYVFGGKG